ncbi:hypothetical protein [Laspinema olomoucense]|uniref:hypothetical protein n=1 Tax=Laspinema olomoucense TaxID=3231600 RepID=UPI0021BAA3F9|nr:hypothetical protein [Laspinema sp. D3d]MCT7972114.1 hypothetical protein [Laspinema sp. D3d]
MALELFDPSYYRSMNPDLGGLSNEEALQHLVTFGLVEGREFSRWVTPQMVDTYADWNCGIYPNAEAFNSPQTRLRTAFEHLRDFGLNEGRPLRVETDLVISSPFSPLFQKQVRPEYFNAEYYQQRYADLGGLSNQQLFQHFVNFGVNEGRQGSSYFSVKTYLENSTGLQQLGFSNQQALEHFIRFGVEEGQRGERLSFVSQVQDRLQENLVYSSLYYRSQYQDLAGLDDTQLFEHFQDFGRNEGRRASPYFDVNTYLASNPDLQQAGLTNKQAIAHFMAFGFEELRKTTPLVAEVEALKNNLATAPFLGEVQLGFRQNLQQTRVANPDRVDGVLSNEDRVDYYRLEYLRTPTLEFPGLSEQINIKVLNVNPDFLPESLRNPLNLDVIQTGIDNQVLEQVNLPIETTVLPPEAFTVVAELNSSDPNDLVLEGFTQQFNPQNVNPDNFVLMVEASDELTNPTPYSVIYRYPFLAPPPPPMPAYLAIAPNLPPGCFDSPIASMADLPMATVETGTLSPALWDIGHSPEGLNLLG